jgi:hypothetical protein|tara:strand:+ start:368 stop:706 length:339 start_codon:yes stop_codon:yes gene_type:complete
VFILRLNSLIRKEANYILKGIEVKVDKFNYLIFNIMGFKNRVKKAKALIGLMGMEKGGDVLDYYGGGSTSSSIIDPELSMRYGGSVKKKKKKKKMKKYQIGGSRQASTYSGK